VTERTSFKERNTVLNQIEPKAADYSPTTDAMVQSDQAIALLSIAISLKRIADKVDGFYEHGIAILGS
jgi:hypothetical protein